MECALKCVALHAKLQFRVCCLFAGDAKGIQIEQSDAVVDHDMLKALGNLRPHVLRFLGRALQDENAAFLQAGERIGMLEDVGVG